ncbi:hypothetical protein BVX94_02360 [bacterium B17]|nr:hypothetical protein BVX94_02360 [bacterium B17]
MAKEVAEKLMSRAEELVAVLVDSGQDSSVNKDSLRDYSIKVDLSFHGRVVIYYSPKKDKFSYQLEKVTDDEVKAVVDLAWTSKDSTKPSLPAERDVDTSGVQIYVDGSYINDSVGYGAVAVEQDKAVWETCGSVPPEEAGTTRQVAGELKATIEALEWCKSKNIQQVCIFYDYKGIEDWATGTWKAKNAVTQQYAQYISSLDVNIQWVKVESHTGDRWNEYADKLAKKGAGTSSNAPKQQDLYGVFDDLTKRIKSILAANDFLCETKQDKKDPCYHRQITISKNDNSLGYINIYATDKKGAYVLFHEVKDTEQRCALEALLNPDPTAKCDIFAEIEHYYAELKPFAAFKFDFIALARAVQSVWTDLFSETLPIDDIRYDFKALEKFFEQLKSSRQRKT